MSDREVIGEYLENHNHTLKKFILTQANYLGRQIGKL
jgi:hypothetical protein